MAKAKTKKTPISAEYKDMSPAELWQLSHDKEAEHKKEIGKIANARREKIAALAEVIGKEYPRFTDRCCFFFTPIETSFLDAHPFPSKQAKIAGVMTTVEPLGLRFHVSSHDGGKNEWMDFDWLACSHTDVLHLLSVIYKEWMTFMDTVKQLRLHDPKFPTPDDSSIMAYCRC